MNTKMPTPEEFQDFFDQGMSYEEFLDSIEDENYRKKYDTYTRRVKFDDATKKEIQQEITYDIYLAVIAADWCFDSQINSPILAKIAELSDKIHIRFFVKEDYMDYLMQTNGGNKVPYAMIFSEDGYFITKWVEKPAETYKLYGEVRKELGWQIEKKDFYHEYMKRFMRKQRFLRAEAIKEIKERILKAEYIQRSSFRLNAPESD